MSCKNHLPPKGGTDKCAGCGEEFGRDCLSQYEGKNYCSACLKAEAVVTPLWRGLGGGADELSRMKRSLIGCSVVLIVVLLTIMFLIVYPLLRPLDVGRCGANLKKVYEALLAYAEENDGWFPPENDDLLPLLEGNYLKDAKLLLCPGARRAFGEQEHMRGSGRSFEGAISYHYQGGLGLPEEKESPQSLMWDTTRRNHRGKGINVLYTDGVVKFTTKGLAKIRLRTIHNQPRQRRGAFLGRERRT